jgi:acyl-CoA oxidase
MTLSAERKNATFSANALIELVNGPRYKQKLEFEKLFSSNPLFDRTNDPFLSRPDYTRISIERSFETYRLIKANKEFLGAHSPLHGEGGFRASSFGVASGLSDHFSLFVATIMSQGTKEQVQEWLLKAVNLQLIGTYAQTELGHGSNVRGLETTATYDPETDEFIIDSPTTSSAKWWPGALGLLATHAVLYARLLIAGKDHGFHAFMVQIRDENHRPLPGVEVGDLGPKMGYAAYDSGYLLVRKLRIPRFNMFAKFQQVEKGGAYKKAPASLQKIAYFTMLKTRVGIAWSASNVLAKSLTISIRYNASRRQGFNDSNNDKSGEKVILDHRIQQSRLFPLLGAAYAINFAAEQVFLLLKDFEERLRKSVDGQVDSSILPELHGSASGMKAFSTEISLLGTDEARKLCGGHGYTLSSGIGMHYLTTLPSVTYEGDIVPMALQCARYLVKNFKAAVSGKPLGGPTVAYLAAQQFDSAKLPQNGQDFRDLAKIRALYEAASRNCVAAAAQELEDTMVSKKLSFDSAWTECHVIMYRAAYTHTLTFIITKFVEAIQQMKDEKIRAVMSRLCSVFAIARIQTLSVADHRISAKLLAEAQVVFGDLLDEIRPDAVTLVDGFGFTDFQLVSTIGSFDNSDMYQKMVESARRNPLNEPKWLNTFHSEHLAKFLNKEFLKKGSKI